MGCTTIIVNGFARAGKDSFVDACGRHLHNAGKVYDSFSSIDPVRNLLRGAGIDLSNKTEADRKLLADVGAALEAHSNWRTNHCIHFVKNQRIRSTDFLFDTVIFLHIREPENIAKVIAGIKERGLGDVHTVLLRSPREVRPDNVADNSVLGVTYDDTLYNDSDLAALDVLAGSYLAKKGLI